jgi:uncharacterized protein
MYENIIYEHEYFKLKVEENIVYIKTNKVGYDINQFKEINDRLPRLKITEFIKLKTALQHGMNSYVPIGEYKDFIDIVISKDQLEATATVYLSQEDISKYSQSDFMSLIQNKAELANIQYGLDLVNLVVEIKSGVPFTIAKGLEPVRGDDAVIKLYELNESRPEVVGDGTVNHYEMNLINKVDMGDWVGERIEPTSGKPGRTIFGEIIKPEPGKQEKLIYDRKTIQEVLDEEKGITTLRSKRLGAVGYENGVLSVSNYLEIAGKVSFDTGNIDFDGYVDVKDSVDDNFSVAANQDIQILGELGVGAVDFIESREGSIFIRGGIAGQDKAEIICNGDLITKFASDCKIKCNGSVYISSYAINCEIRAKEVILNSMNSKIIGGSVIADIRVCAGEIGSKAEVLTHIHILGFDRVAMREEYDGLGHTIEKLKQMIHLFKEKISIIQMKEAKERDQNQVKELFQMELEYERCQKSLKIYTQRKKNISGYLQAKGEGEIRALKTIYPNVSLKINKEEMMNKELKNCPK